LEGALISLPYANEKYLYIFSFYTQMSDGDLLTFISNNTEPFKWIQIEGMYDYVYLSNEKITETYEEFKDGMIYFANLKK